MKSFRYVILALSGSLLSLILSSVVAFNACFICLQNKETSPLYKINPTRSDEEWASRNLSLAERRYIFNSTMKGLAFSASFAGAIIGVQPLLFPLRKFGVHRYMIVTGSIAVLAVSFTPLVLSSSFILFLALRILNGLTNSMLFTVVGIICNKWAPLEERGIFVAVLTGHVEIAALLTMPIAPAIGSHVGWPSVFYTYGAVLAIAILLFALFYRDDPSTHPFVSKEELELITNGKPSGTAKPEPTPYRAILSTPVIWASWISIIGTFFVGQFSITFAPIYLNKVLAYSPTKTGLICAIPLASQFAFKIVSGFFSDKMTFIDEVLKMRVFNSIALGGCAILFAIVTIINPTGNIWDTILIMTPIALLGFHSGGFPKCLIMVSQKHIGFVMSIFQIIACSTMLCGSFLVPILAPHEIFEEWRKVFIMYSCLLVVSNTVFVIFATNKPADWTSSKKDVIIESSSSDSFLRS